MAVQTKYQHLEARADSRYRQLFIKGRHLRAEVVYRDTVGPEPETPEQVAEEYEIPVEAVYEAIDYCIHNQRLLDAERAREEADIRARGWDKPPFVPPKHHADS